VSEPSTLSFALTYAGTLGVAALIFLSQLIAFTALLVLAGTVTFLVRSARVITRRRRR
jgi:hypothetical protein